MPDLSHLVKSDRGGQNTIQRNAFLPYTVRESRLVYSRSRMAIAELFLFLRNGQCLVDYDLRESASMRRYCLLLFKAED